MSDERGSKDKDDMTPPEEAVEDELGDEKPSTPIPSKETLSPALPTSSSLRDQDRNGPLGLFSARWGGGYNNRWRLGYGPSNERGGVEEDTESSSSRAPTPVTAKKEEPEEAVDRKPEDGVEGALERGLRAIQREATPPSSARKKKSA